MWRRASSMAIDTVRWSGNDAKGRRCGDGLNLSLMTNYRTFEQTTWLGYAQFLVGLILISYWKHAKEVWTLWSFTRNFNQTISCMYGYSDEYERTGVRGRWHTHRSAEYAVHTTLHRDCVVCSGNTTSATRNRMDNVGDRGRHVPEKNDMRMSLYVQYVEQ